ncbi:MAG: manganese efflux pump MntP family protein [Treponema sp.]|jgi:putative Mn2+ efflux pump MntP|nr:manganese efflux pump MntP family protein [Treponema sp.]
MIALFLIAVSLSLDAFAVSVSASVSIRDLRRFHAIRASFSFGFFQFFMPLVGWYLGSAFTSYIETFTHWIAFIILGFIGGKMIVESLRGKKAPDANASGSEAKSGGDIRGIGTLLILSVATSIDALAVGISLNIMGLGIWTSAVIIGGITFLICLCGFAFGRFIGSALGKWAALSGGVVLVGIGLKILIQGLFGE